MLGVGGGVAEKAMLERLSFPRISLLRGLALALLVCPNPLGLVWASLYFLVPKQHGPMR